MFDDERDCTGEFRASPRDDLRLRSFHVNFN